MREILFRGKRLDNREWVQGSLLSFGDGRKAIIPSSAKVFMQQGTTTICCNECYDIDPATTGQHTGLTDKNKTKAFEHDCIRELFDDSIGVIRYGDYKNPFNDDGFSHHIGFYVDWISGQSKDMLRKDLGYWLNLVEIIGNIHDNPELLEGAGET